MDDHGWFATGDLARMDAQGYIRITGRTKDVVIRGGENVPVVEIENLLYKHPAISAVALVGCPDPSPSYTRFFTPRRDALPGDLDEIGRRYIGALAGHQTEQEAIAHTAAHGAKLMPAEAARWFPKLPAEAYRP